MELESNSNKDQMIKLFGKKISVPADEAQDLDHHDYQMENEYEIDKDLAENTMEISEESANLSESLQETTANPKTPSIDQETGKSKNAKTEKEQSDAANSTLKKPDKLLPCPRCNSMDTKFCYYNNYNVSQPRHFCKACQRYWTSGGTMRNVPVGAGRRKSKNFASHYYQPITISEAIQAAKINNQNPTLDRNVRVLSFGKCDVGRGIGGESNDDCSSSCTVSNSIDSSVQESPMVRNINGFPIPIPYPTCVPWPFPWTCTPPGFPTAFYQPAYWSVPGTWMSPQSPSSTQTSPSSAGSNSPTLGKHSREGDMIKPENGSILVPKTLRIDDPNEAAKSSIWTTLGIKNESLFRSEKNGVVKTSNVMLANPAALSRSLNFHENS